MSDPDFRYRLVQVNHLYVLRYQYYKNIVVIITIVTRK